MRVIDEDPEMLRQSAEAALHAADETWIHIQAEVTAANGDYDALMSTLMPGGPWGYTIQPQFNGDGTVRAPILTTWDEIRKAYEQVRGNSDMLGAESLVELRSTWYTFQECVSRGWPKGAPEPSKGSHLLGLFPVGAAKGITGELVWPRVPIEMLGRGEVPEGLPTDPVLIRRSLIQLHDRYLHAIRMGDADGLVECLNDDAQGGVRDYVDDTGALVELDGKEGARAHYAALFDTYDIRSVDLLDRVVESWYVFAELRITATPKGEDGPLLAWHTADYQVIGKDHRFMVRIGHGTDIAEIADLA
jgi:hypothetical protein